MQFDALQFCKDYNIPYSLGGKNVSDGRVGINDPYATDFTFHGAFNPVNGTFSSWKTGSHRLEDVISTLLGVSWGKASQIIREYSGVSRLEIQLNEKLKFDIPSGKCKKKHREFIRSRRYSAKYLIEKYDIRAAGNKLIFPVYFNGKIVSYQERDITGKFYKACPTDVALINYKDILFNIDNAAEDTVVVVEGLFDAFRLGDGAVATFGTSYTQKQEALLAKRFKTVIILFDSERKAQRKARTLANELSMMGVNVLVEQNLLINEGVNDPDDLPQTVANKWMDSVFS